MAQAIDLKKGDHGSVLDRQFVHGLVQFFLKLARERLAIGSGGVSQCGHNFGGDLVVFVDFFEAEKSAQAMLPEVSQRGIDGDPVEPREERGLSLEAVDRLKSLDESVLR